MTTAADYMKQAMARLNELISPAVLRDSPYNRQVVLGEVARLSLGQPTTIDQAAMHFRKAVIAICNDPSRALNALVWNVEPASIQKFKPAIEENQQKIAEGQQENINRVEREKEHAKRQKEAEARALEMIAAFHPISFRGTEFAVMADTKKLLTDHINKHRAKGTDMEIVAKSVRDHIAKVYSEVEKKGTQSQ